MNVAEQRALSAAVEGWYDWQRWFPRVCTIRDKSGREVPLNLTPSQQKLFSVVDEQQRAGKPVRIIVLKPRQVHMSVGCAALLFRHVAFFPGQKARVIADRHKSASSIWDYYWQFLESYKDPEGLRILDVASKNTGQNIVLQGGGEITTESADNVSVGRGQSLRYLHLSEYAFWRDPAQLMTGLLQSVPDDPGTMVIIESTANGWGNSFHDRWNAAGDPERRGDWKRIFFPWFEHPEYEMPVPDIVQFQNSLSREEIELWKRHNIALEKVYWRRWAIVNKCEGKIDRFRQEYPATAEEAFLTTGRAFFSIPSLQRQRAVEPMIVGDIERIQVGTTKRLVVTENEQGYLKLWRKPEPGHTYVIGADTAEGLEANENEPGNPDSAAAPVLNRETGEQVAELCGRIQPAAFGDLLAALGEYFNWAYLVPEINNTGIATLDALLRSGYPQSLIFARERDPDDQRAGLPKKLGWRTTSVTRPQLLSALDSALLEGSIYVRSKAALYEMYSFVVKPNGKAEAAAGSHDDRVFGLGLAVIGLRYAPKVKRLAETQKDRGPVNWRNGRRKSEEDD